MSWFLSRPWLVSVERDGAMELVVGRIQASFPAISSFQYLLAVMAAQTSKELQELQWQA